MNGKITQTASLLLADMAAKLSPTSRLQRLVDRMHEHFHCGAIALLQLDEEHFRPLAINGLVPDTLGRRFAISQHPRLAAILGHRDVTRFHHESTLPDPYDGLLIERAGESLPVHDCMGISLFVEERPWGILTLDTLDIDTFGTCAQADLRSLAPIIEATLRITQIEGTLNTLSSGRIDLSTPPTETQEDAVIGQSKAIVHLLHELDVVADSELPVLLLGETGVGKELFARRLHQLSRRKNKPLVHVNCAALPEALAESELFGHIRGAFSGALAERPGRFDAANEGTLFLDEVGELPLPVQAKLLRTLQNGEIQRLGEDRPRHVDVRIIAATNRTLRDLVRDGAFRADLYHRLSVYPIPIPPLRERDDDVLLLAGRFLEINRSRLGLRSLRLSTEAQRALYNYPWPGNVRELEHAISRAAIKAISHGARHNEIVTLEIDMLDLEDEKISVPAPIARPDTTAPLPLRQTVENCQRQAIIQALESHGGNWANAARQLEIDASNLHKLARRLGLKNKG